jgi:tyrosyl-tRNA synthetase
VWKAAGMDMSRVKFLWCADEISSNAASYWPKMLDIARCFDLDRIKKCCMIMARAENTLSGAQILYPLMQCTDIFFLKADVCQLGVDQRKVNMLARDYCT